MSATIERPPHPRTGHHADCLCSLCTRDKHPEVAPLGVPASRLSGIEAHLTASAELSILIVAEALASRGMTLKATHDGSFRIECAKLTREEALRLNQKNARDSMHFTPHDGKCWSCRADLVAQNSLHGIAGGLNVTGCRECGRSFCD